MNPYYKWSGISGILCLTFGSNLIRKFSFGVNLSNFEISMDAVLSGSIIYSFGVLLKLENLDFFWGTVV